MNKELRYEQRSHEWFQARLSKITGSKIADLMPGERVRAKYTQTQRSKLMEIAAENLTGIIEPTYTTAAMQWGIDHEEEAREIINFMTGYSFRKCGFYLLDEWTGASPDGVDDEADAVLEIKCPGSKKHLQYLLDADTLKADYEWQVCLEMLCAEKDKAILASYDPRFKDIKKQVVIVEIEAAPEKMNILKARISECIELLNEWTE